MTIHKLHTDNAKLVFENEKCRCLKEFSKTITTKQVIGQWESSCWLYKGRRLHFTELAHNNGRSQNSSNNNHNAPIYGEIGDLIRCFVVRLIEARQSAELIAARLLAFRFLYFVIGENFDNWTCLSHADFDKTLAFIKKYYDKPVTIYHRVGSLRAFHQYLCSLRLQRNNNIYYFLSNPLIWNHYLKNPAREKEFNRSEKIDARGDKYPLNLDQAVGKLRYKLLKNPDLECKHGHDFIRINISAFYFSLGLRTGEITRLPLNAFEHDKRSGVNIVRCWTEKGAPPIARPVPNIWNDALTEAYEYLVRECGDARKRAADIEANGFKFITDIIKKHGVLPKNIQSDLEFIGINHTNLCKLSVITSNFSITEKSFFKGGLYSDHLVLQPSTMALRLAKYFAKLRAGIKSNKTTKTIYGYLISNNKKIPMQRIGLSAGLSRCNIRNVPYIKELIQECSYKLLDLHARESNDNKIHASRRRIIVNWLDSKIENLNKKSAPNAGALVNYKSWINQLESQYASYLMNHYKENCDAETLKSKKFNYTISSSSFEESLPLSKHLIVVWESQFDCSTTKYGILPRPVFNADIYNYFSSKGSKITVFERYNIRNDKGEVYCISPHQIRHWVTNSLLLSGPNEMLIDLWMGRTPGLLRHYDHRTPRERAEYVRSKCLYSSNTPPTDWLGRKIISMREHNFTQEEIDDFITEKLSILHFTPWGYCSRDLTVMPCVRGLMCLKGFDTDDGCPHFHIDPTDLTAKKNIQNMLDNYTKSLIALEPRYNNLRDDFINQLDNSETLDQHLLHVVRIIKSCKLALKAYKTPTQNRKLIQPFKKSYA